MSDGREEREERERRIEEEKRKDREDRVNRESRTSGSRGGWTPDEAENRSETCIANAIRARRPPHPDQTNPSPENFYLNYRL